MPFFKVDDALHSHPKAQEAGDEALGLWVRAGAFCMAYLTDGFVPEWWVRQQPRGMVKAKRLVAALMWHPTERDGKPGWLFHEWRQDTKEQIQADREKWRKKKHRQRMSPGDTQGDSPGESPGESRVYTRTLTHTPSVVTLGGDGTEGDAHPAAPPICSKHQTNTDEPCHACRMRRLWDENHAHAAEQNQLNARRRLREIAANCLICHGTNWIPDTDPAVKCSHREQVRHA